MSDIQPGDVVVRVEIAGPDPLPGVSRPEGGKAPPVGVMTRVLETVMVGRPRELGLVVAGYPSLHPTRAWHHLMFRKIRPASDEFTRTVRACRPIKQREGVE